MTERIGVGDEKAILASRASSIPIMKPDNAHPARYAFSELTMPESGLASSEDIDEGVVDAGFLRRKTERGLYPHGS